MVPGDLSVTGVGTLESIVSTAELGPVLVRRGPYEYPCELTISDVGAEVTFRGTDGFLPWSKTFEWVDVARVDVGANPSGALLTVGSYRFRFPQLSITQLYAIIDPLRQIIGTLHRIEDPPPSPLARDLTVEVISKGRVEVWYSDWIVEVFPRLVLDSMDWLVEQPGVELVEQEDHCVYFVTGSFELAVFDHLGSWWMERVDGFDQIYDWPVPAP
ncbi:MAG: hypothetical protein ABSB09_07000 [Acidimicrobiales bacterium]